MFLVFKMSEGFWAPSAFAGSDNKNSVTAEWSVSDNVAFPEDPVACGTGMGITLL